jgi:predicted methyltransferase
MNRMCVLPWAVAVFSGICSATTSRAADAIPQYVSAAIAADSRFQTDLVRDPDRKPAELAVFSGMKPGDKVADFTSSNAYWSRIFSKVVGSKGEVYLVVPLIGRPADPGARSNGIDDALGTQNILDYSNVQVIWETAGQFSLPEQLDVVWAANSYHDLHTKKYGPADLTAFNQNVFHALKPGGLYGVVDFAAASGSGFTQTDNLLRSEKDAVKAEIVTAGFVLEGESALLNNGNDDHAKAAANDKADQFLLRFKKPANAAPDKRLKASAMTGYFGNTYNLGARTIWFNKDGTYQEFGANDTQEGTWFFDADGNSCQLHEFPPAQRALTFCHAFAPNRKPGDKWTNTANGRSSEVSLLPGHVYPEGVVGGLKGAP